jgi:hypothetical protein
MSKLIVAVVSLWLMVLLAEPALANCTYTTVLLPDGRSVMCM